MPISVRLDSETEKLLERTSRFLKATKSDVVKKSIKQYCTPIVKEKKQDMSEIIKDLIQKHPSSGRGDLSVKGEEILRELFKRKRHDRH